MYERTSRGPETPPILGDDFYAPESSHRGRILKAAKHRFARFGFDNTSLHDIARHADVPAVELLVHFGDKNHLLAAILEEGWGTINPKLANLARTSTSAREALLSMMAMIINLADKDEELARLLLFEGRFPDPDSAGMSLSTGYREFMKLCTELVLRGQREGRFWASYNPQVAASVLVGAVEGVLRDRLLAEQENSLTPYNGLTVMMALDALISHLETTSPMPKKTEFREREPTTRR